MSSNKPARTPEQDAALRQRIRELAAHNGQLGRYVAADLLKVLMGDELSQDVAGELMTAAFEDFKPKSAAERMLVEQLVVTHVQVLRAHRRISKAEQYDNIEKSVNIASKLQADFRKTLTALKDWNAPPKSFIVAQQANVAHQQVIQQNNADPPNELGTKSA